MEQSILNQPEAETPASVEEIKVDNLVESTHEKAPEDFVYATKVLLETLKKEEKTAEEGFVFSYGSLTKTTSKGVPLGITSLSWMSEDGLGEKGKQRIVLVAKNDSTGKVVGLRLSDIRDKGLSINENGSYLNSLIASGEIFTRNRGEGIATVLDEAFVEILTKMANEHKQHYPGEHQIHWNVENRHLKRLEESKNKDLDTDNNEREVEQKRWQSLYGEGGKFGLKRSGEFEYTKKIEPIMEEGQDYRMQPIDIQSFKNIEKGLEEVVQ